MISPSVRFGRVPPYHIAVVSPMKAYHSAAYPIAKARGLRGEFLVMCFFLFPWFLFCFYLIFLQHPNPVRDDTAPVPWGRLDANIFPLA